MANGLSRSTRRTFPVAERKGLERESFENHYNVRLNRCFMLEENTTLTKDAGKSYAMKLLTLSRCERQQELRQLQPAQLAKCRTRPCKSEQEFRSLIRQFMED